MGQVLNLYPHSCVNGNTLTHDKGGTTTTLCVMVDPVHMKRVIHNIMPTHMIKDFLRM